jgi:hypothetical protein
MLLRATTFLLTALASTGAFIAFLRPTTGSPKPVVTGVALSAPLAPIDPGLRTFSIPLTGLIDSATGMLLYDGTVLIATHPNAGPFRCTVKRGACTFAISLPASPTNSYGVSIRREDDPPSVRPVYIGWTIVTVK